MVVNVEDVICRCRTKAAGSDVDMRRKQAGGVAGRCQTCEHLR
jgi:hypothetical protein